MPKPSANMQKSRRAQHMDKQPGFQRYQFEFAAHIRNPRAHPRPIGVDSRRMAVYKELLYNNIESFLLTCFPVLRKVLSKRRWDKLVRAFFIVHRSHTPYFRQIPDEFLHFLQNEWSPEPGYPDYLLELAHYEWIELVLSVSNRGELGESAGLFLEKDADLMSGIPVLNPVLANLAYRWPVHQIQPRVKVRPCPTFLLVFRDADMHVRFMEQSQVSARFLSLLEAGVQTGEQALRELALELGLELTAELRGFAQNFLADLRQAGAVLGARQA